MHFSCWLSKTKNTFYLSLQEISLMLICGGVLIFFFRSFNIVGKNMHVKPKKKQK